MYSNCCCSCSFEREIIKIGQSSHKMYSNNILNFQVSTTILNACTKRVWKLIECTTLLKNKGNFVWIKIFILCRRVFQLRYFICRQVFLFKIILTNGSPNSGQKTRPHNNQQKKRESVKLSTLLSRRTTE